MISFKFISEMLKVCHVLCLIPTQVQKELCIEDALCVDKLTTNIDAVVNGK